MVEARPERRGADGVRPAAGRVGVGALDQQHLCPEPGRGHHLVGDERCGLETVHAGDALDAEAARGEVGRDRRRERALAAQQRHPFHAQALELRRDAAVQPLAASQQQRAAAHGGQRRPGQGVRVGVGAGHDRVRGVGEGPRGDRDRRRDAVVAGQPVERDRAQGGNDQRARPSSPFTLTTLLMGMTP